MSVGSDAQVREQLSKGLAELELPATSRQQDALIRFLALLERWNAVYNLTAVREPQAMLSHHVLDCLAAVIPLRRQLGSPDGRRVIDVGSGAGLPGIVLGIMSPALGVLCVDSGAKKVAFIQQVIGELELHNVSATHARVEALREKAAVVTARAYATLAKLVASTSHLLEARGVWMAMKGKPSPRELAEVGKAIDVFHVEPLAVPGLGEDRCLVWMRPASDR